MLVKSYPSPINDLLHQLVVKVVLAQVQEVVLALEEVEVMALDLEEVVVQVEAMMEEGN